MHITRSADRALHRDTGAVRLCSELEVSEAIVGFHPVDVVHVLNGKQRTSEEVRHYQPVLGDISPLRPHLDGDRIF